MVFVVCFSSFPSHAFPFSALYLVLGTVPAVEWVYSTFHPARAASTEQHWSLEWCIWGLRLNWHIKQDKVLFRWFHRHLYLISSVKNKHSKSLQGSFFSSMSLRAPPATHTLPVTANVLEVGFSLLQHRKQFIPVSAFTDSKRRGRDHLDLLLISLTYLSLKIQQKKGSVLSPAKMN